MTTPYNGKEGLSSRVSDLPPVDWPVLRRVRVVGGIGLGCAAIAIGITLLLADIPNGLAFSKYSPNGTTDLWPAVVFVGLWLTASGLAGAILLPLYRWRFGGHLIGIIVVILSVPADLLAYRHSTTSEYPPAWQGVTFLLAFAAIFASLGDGMRAYALGQPTGEPRPPVN